MKVLVIPEDFRKDQYILKPIIKSMFQKIGYGSANVRVCQEPLLGGIDQARNWERIEEVFDRYRGMVDVFLLIVDRDGNPGRRMFLNNHEKKAKECLPPGRIFLAENAWQEVEVWILAGLELPSDWSWQEIRDDSDSKETFFEPFARQQNLLNDPGQGRKTLAIAAAKKYDRIRSRCPEDIASLEERIIQALNAR